MLTCDLGGGYALPYIEVGRGPPLVLVHGSMSDFRVWSPVLGPLSRSYRLIVPSLRHCFPDRWRPGGDYTIGRHTADLIDFLEQRNGRVHLLGHSRGGHIAFRVAEQRPDLLHSLILAEPGGDLDDNLQPVDEPRLPPLRNVFVAAAERIEAGDIEQGLAIFVDAIDGKGIWERLPAAAKQQLRDNAATLIGQLDEQRQPYSRDSTARIVTPTLLIDGALAKPASARNVRVLAAHIAGASRATIPHATHVMFAQDPVRFSAAVLTFLDGLPS